jgi:hypothetical protein
MPERRRCTWRHRRGRWRRCESYLVELSERLSYQRAQAPPDVVVDVGGTVGL